MNNKCCQGAHTLWNMCTVHIFRPFPYSGIFHVLVLIKYTWTKKVKIGWIRGEQRYLYRSGLYGLALLQGRENEGGYGMGWVSSGWVVGVTSMRGCAGPVGHIWREKRHNFLCTFTVHDEAVQFTEMEMYCRCEKTCSRGLPRASHNGNTKLAYQHGELCNLHLIMHACGGASVRVGKKPPCDLLLTWQASPGATASTPKISYFHQ